MSRLEKLLDAMRPLLEEQDAYGAWLFGSQARGTAGAESDIDLIVVQPSDEPSPLRRLAYSDAIAAAGGAVDLLVYTPEEFETMRSAGRPFLVDALLEAKPVHLGTTWAQLVERELQTLRGGAAASLPTLPEVARAEAERWLGMAEYDFGFARYAFDGGHYNQACFIAQQAAEKAVKAIAYGLGERRVRTHSLVDMVDRYAERAPDLLELRALGKSLDVHYVEARYPNGQDEGIPAETYTRQMAEEALEAAEKFVDTAARAHGRDASSE